MIYDVFMLSHGKPTTNICKKVMEVHPYGSNGDESLPSKWKQCVNPVEYKTRHTNCKNGFLVFYRSGEDASFYQIWDASKSQASNKWNVQWLLVKKVFLSEVSLGKTNQKYV